MCQLLYSPLWDYSELCSILEPLGAFLALLCLALSYPAPPLFCFSTDGVVQVAHFHIVDSGTQFLIAVLASMQQLLTLGL